MPCRDRMQQGARPAGALISPEPEERKQGAMQQFLTIGFYAALAAVAIVLVIGVANLARRDDKQVSRSNKLMRLRVIFQAIAIAFLVLIGIAAGAIKFGG